MGGVSEGTVTPGAELWLRDSCRAVEMLIWLPGLQGSAIISFKCSHCYIPAQHLRGIREIHFYLAVSESNIQSAADERHSCETPGRC